MEEGETEQHLRGREALDMQSSRKGRSGRVSNVRGCPRWHTGKGRALERSQLLKSQCLNVHCFFPWVKHHLFSGSSFTW